MNQNYQKEYFTFERGDVACFLPSAYQRVLEIGCGEGRFARHLPAAIDYWAVEPDSIASGIAGKRIANVLCGTFETCCSKIPDGYFDLVICNDVIEHMPDHLWFLKKIKEKMKPEAFLVGSVPNVRYVTNLVDLLVRRDWPYTNSGVLDSTHLRFFTAKSLRGSLTETGFSVDMLKGINSIFRRPNKTIDVLKVAVAAGSIICTLGHSSDVRFFQFGFRARLRDEGML